MQIFAKLHLEIWTKNSTSQTFVNHAKSKVFNFIVNHHNITQKNNIKGEIN